MNNKNYYILIAGLINLFTAFIHTIGGQSTLVNPMNDSNMTNQEKAEWFAAWHIVTIILFASSYILLRAYRNRNNEIAIKYIGYLYILFSLTFIISSVIHGLFTPQWILLLPIGVLAIVGFEKGIKTRITH